MTGGPTSRAGLAPAAAGGAILSQLAVLRLALDADATSVRFLGRALDWRCAMRSQLGLPCPTCGMTRSVVLSLHGHLGQAWSSAPGGPAVVLGLAIVALALLWLGCVQWRGRARAGVGAARWIRRGALACAGTATVVWLAGWAAALAAALGKRIL